MMSFSNCTSIFVILFLACGNICSAKQVPPFFIFGDSLVDAGNNNYLISIAKANSEPNGVDFEPNGGHPTGRFTNGKTVADLIGEKFGSKCYPKPYLSSGSNGAAKTCGVNYASGGAGILNTTGYIFGGRINMDAQIDNFANTQQFLISSLGMERAMALFNASIFPIIIGSNDFLDNYLVPIVEIGIRKLIPPEVFIKQLIERYKCQLNRMYNLGARKILVVNVGPIGCIPYQREVNPLTKGCALDSNQLVKAFNEQLKDLVIDLNSNLRRANLFYLNVYRIVSDLLNTHANYGFNVIDSACCKVAGHYGGLLPCGKLSTYCLDRSKYFFWDPYHPSEAANLLILDRLLNGDTEDIFPLNIREIIQLYG